MHGPTKERPHTFLVDDAKHCCCYSSTVLYTQPRITRGALPYVAKSLRMLVLLVPGLFRPPPGRPSLQLFRTWYHVHSSAGHLFYASLSVFVPVGVGPLYFFGGVPLTSRHEARPQYLQ